MNLGGDINAKGLKQAENFQDQKLLSKHQHVTSDTTPCSGLKQRQCFHLVLSFMGAIGLFLLFIQLED